MSSQTFTENITIRPVQIQDLPIVKSLILQMLTDSPYAYGETLKDALERTEMAWSQHIEDMSILTHHAAFIAFNQDDACGFVTGDATSPQAPPGTIIVGHLWVAPQQRGTGLGRELMATITEWAHEQHAQFLGLGVTEMNTNAMKFYEHLGYTDTGIRFPLSWDPTKQIIILGRKL